MGFICRWKGHEIEIYHQRKKEYGIFFACKRCSKVVKGKSVEPRPFKEYEKIAYREQEKRISNGK